MKLANNCISRCIKTKDNNHLISKSKKMDGNGDSLLTNKYHRGTEERRSLKTVARLKC